MALATARIQKLTDAELEAVILEIQALGETAGVVALWGVLLGYPLANHTGPPVAPWSVAIPKDQWSAITATAIEASETVVSGDRDTMPGGVMLNSGPSSIEL